ncbi:MAG: response regulator [Acidisphaera sp.]|nr:response regulator [Acidisphaera sp.]
MPEAPTRPDLAGRRVLVVENEYLIAEALREALEDAGAGVLGPVPDVAAALNLLAAGAAPDGAVLDVNLGDEMAWPVADALLARGVPFVLATGYDASVIPARYAGVRRCEKPADLDEIARALFG